jgi:hypothetical protein
MLQITSSAFSLGNHTQKTVLEKGRAVGVYNVIKNSIYLAVSSSINNQIMACP